jgi:hypothetical protein
MRSAAFWIEHKNSALDEMIEKCKPNPMDNAVTAATPVNGRQFVGGEALINMFGDYTYVAERNEIFMPRGETGQFLGPEAFNNWHGGSDFQLDDLGGKTTKNAWEAFVKSQCVRFKKAMKSEFRPDLPPGTIIPGVDTSFLNTYIPFDYPIKDGDANPFVDLVNRMLPNKRDGLILMSYLAALVQYRGQKFRWSPLLQGTPGNGKSTVSYVMRKIIGNDYSHVPD